jgi:hypothetical protein
MKMRISWLALLASDADSGMPSGSAPTSAAAWSCDEDAEKWGYSKNKGKDMPPSESRTCRDAAFSFEEGWSAVRAEESLRAFCEAPARVEAGLSFDMPYGTLVVSFQ